MKTHQTQRSDSLVKSSADHDFTNRSWSPPRVFANAKTKIATVDSKMAQQNHSIVPDNGQSNTTVTKITPRATNRVKTMAHNNNTAINWNKSKSLESKSLEKSFTSDPRTSIESTTKTAYLPLRSSTTGTTSRGSYRPKYTWESSNSTNVTMRSTPIQ